MSDTKKKKLFTPIGLSGEKSRWIQWNKDQPIKDGIRINQYTHDGKKTGYWESYWANDKLESKGSYINDKKDGYWEWYWMNGNLWSKGSYINDKQYGLWEGYNKQSGELEYRYIWKNGKLVEKLPIAEAETPKKKLFRPIGLSGEDSRYDKWNKEQPIKDGVRINQYTNDGKKEGYWEEYRNGYLYSKGLYINDKKEGNWENYYENGGLATKVPYKNDKMNGMWEQYFHEGQLRAKGLYKDGKEDGVWEHYFPNGDLYSRYLYDNGEVVEQLFMVESKTPSFLLKEEMVLIREGNVQDYIENILSKIKNLPYETKKKYLTIAISTLLGYTSYPVIQSIIDKSPDKEAREITHRVLNKKDNLSMFNDGTKLHLSKKGLQHIVDEEKPKLIAYALGDGKITVGYGHAEPIGTTKLKVGQKISKEQAKQYLKQDLKVAADGVRRMFSEWKEQNKNYKVTQDMFDALVSMAFNIGVSGLRQSEMVRHLKLGDYKTAGQLIKQTNINPDTFPGLEKRRDRESNMFLSYLSKPTDVNT